MSEASKSKPEPTNPEPSTTRAHRSAASQTVMTYDDVAERIASMTPPTTRKLCSTSLNGWMRVFGRSGADVAHELEPAVLASNIAHYERDPSFLALSSGSRNNRRSGIRQVSALVVESHAAERMPGLACANPYWDLVYKAMTTATLPRGRRKDLVKRRIQGHMPRTREQVLSVAKDVGANAEELLSHVWLWQPTLLFDLKNPGYTWNESHYELTKLPYSLESLPERVEERIVPFATWRRASSPRDLSVELLDGSFVELKRSGAWSRRTGQTADEPAPTEKVHREFYKAFFGFCALPKDAFDPRMRGLGIPLESLRLAHLFVGENVTAFCDFQKRRNGRFDHTGLKKLREDWCLLIGSSRSYARYAQRTNHEDLMDVLGKEATPATPDAWIKWCNAQMKIVDDWIDVETEGR